MALKQFGIYKYWLVPVISALGKWRQEHQGFKAGLEYKASSHGELQVTLSLKI